MVCIVGKIAYEKYSCTKSFNFGWQADILVSKVFIMHYPQGGPALIRVNEPRLVAKTAEIQIY